MLCRTGVFLKGRGRYSFVPGIAVTKFPKFVTKYSVRIHVKMLSSKSRSLRQTVLSGDIILQTPSKQIKKTKRSRAGVEGGRRVLSLRALSAGLKGVGYLMLTLISFKL